MTATWPRSFEDVDRKEKEKGGGGGRGERGYHFGGLSFTNMDGAKNFCKDRRDFLRKITHIFFFFFLSIHHFLLLTTSLKF